MIAYIELNYRKEDLIEKNIFKNVHLFLNDPSSVSQRIVFCGLKSQKQEQLILQL